MENNPGQGRELSNIEPINSGIPVIITDYDPYRHKVAVVDAYTKNPIEPVRTYETPVDKTKSYEIEDKKVLKADKDPNAPLVEVTREYARMGGSPGEGFFSIKEKGNFIKGPLSLIMRPDEIRLSSITTLNPLIITGFPSTIVTPLPTCVWSIPGIGIIKPLMESVLTMSTILAAVGASA